MKWICTFNHWTRVIEQTLLMGCLIKLKVSIMNKQTRTKCFSSCLHSRVSHKADGENVKLTWEFVHVNDVSKVETLLSHLSPVTWMQHQCSRLWLLWTNWHSVILHGFKCVSAQVFEAAKGSVKFWCLPAVNTAAAFRSHGKDEREEPARKSLWVTRIRLFVSYFVSFQFLLISHWAFFKTKCTKKSSSFCFCTKIQNDPDYSKNRLNPARDHSTHMQSFSALKSHDHFPWQTKINLISEITLTLK